MSTSEINIIATIYPRAGKANRVLELLKAASEFIKNNEPGTLRYHVNLEKKKNGEDEIVILETYKDKAAIGIHGSSQDFKATQKKMADEDLIAKPLQLKFVKPMGGFLSRL